MKQFIIICKSISMGCLLGFWFVVVFWFGLGFFTCMWGLNVSLTSCAFIRLYRCTPRGFPWLYTTSEISLWQLGPSTEEAQDESARCSVKMGTFSCYPVCKNYTPSSSDYANKVHPSCFVWCSSLKSLLDYNCTSIRTAVCYKISVPAKNHRVHHALSNIWTYIDFKSRSGIKYMTICRCENT